MGNKANSSRYLKTKQALLIKNLDYIVALLSALIFTTWHAILTSLVISNYDEVDLSFGYVFGVEWLAFVPLGIAMLIIIWVGRVKPTLFLELSTGIFFKHFIFALIIFVIHSVWQQLINSTFLSSEFTYQAVERDFIAFLEMRYLAYIIMIGLVGGIIKLKEHGKISLYESNLRLELQRAQLREIELKMNPEIIYPTLDYIRRNISEDPERSSQMVILLAGLLRKLVDNMEGDLVLISDDMQLFLLYRDMLQLRKEKEIEFEKKVDSLIINKKIPPIILLIPLIEDLFFGKFSHHFRDVSKMTYSVIIKEDEISCVEVSFEPIQEEENFTIDLNDTSFVKEINGFLDRSLSSEFEIITGVDGKIFKLCLEHDIKRGVK